MARTNGGSPLTLRGAWSTVCKGTGGDKLRREAGNGFKSLRGNPRSDLYHTRMILSIIQRIFGYYNGVRVFSQVQR